MEFGFQKLPAGVELMAFSKRVFDVLAEHTSFPWPIMQAQSKRIGANPARLRPEELPELSPLLVAAVGRFTSPEAREQVRRQLEELAGQS